MDPEQAEARRIEARRWFAVALGTALMFMSYLLYLFAFASADDEDSVFVGGLLGIATGVVPLVFFGLAAASRRERSTVAALASTAVFVTIGLPIAILDIPTGLTAGFGAGGIVAVRRDAPATVVARSAAVIACVAYVFVLRLLIPEAGLMVGAIVPFAAIALADVIRQRGDLPTPS